ncbi:MAG: helix-turn-helix domain-containing protein, partial [Nitrospira sp. NTP1]|nr:helix-turn-helix domain-containing protein [Nitrospira sp. NTP1]
MRLITTKELRTLSIATRHHHLINSRLAILRYADEYGFKGAARRFGLDRKYGFKGAARRFGLDRKTVRTWHRRWVASGPKKLVPRHPRTRRQRISDEAVRLIEQARRELQFGAMRTRFWLDRVHRIRVAAATIRRVCRDLGYPPIRRTGPRRPRQPILFSKEHPGECVQIDVKEVNGAGQKCFQYTALDDCTRYRVLRLYPRKYHGTSLDFLATVRH